MAKFFGKVGYAITSETAPGVWTNSIVEKEYFGDVLKIRKRIEETEYLNDNIIINNRFSIVADAFATNNFSNMVYVEWLGTKWKINRIEVERPRLILSIGGVYNGDTGPVADPS
jgi:hypothetical protein